jgi:aminopeptidase N
MQYGHTPSGDGSYFPLNQIPQEYTYGMTAYDRGSTVVQALRFYLGDSLFFETVREFIDAFAFQAASSYDMRDFMSDYTGWDLSGFFDNWVFNAGTPHYSIDSFSVAPEGDAYRVDVYPRQKRKGPAFTGSGNIMAVAFMDQNWNRFDDTIHFDGASGHSERLLPFEPSVVLADPDEQMCDATTDQIKTIRAPGTYSFDKTFCTLEVTALEDSAFVQVTHNWAPPDSLADPIPGLRISDYRYWKVDGIFPAEFEATGKFFYSVSSFLDNTLITGSNDTLIMLYRLNSADEWHEVDFERVGPWNVGNILVPSLEPGEYSLAVKETGVGIGDEAGPERIVLEIVPNPSGDTFHIILSCENPGDLVIYSESGQVVDRFAIPAGGGELGWVPSTRVPGAYLVVFTDVRDRMRVSGKVIFAP